MTAPAKYTEARSGVGGIGSNHMAAIAGSDLINPWNMYMYSTSCIYCTHTGAAASIGTSKWNATDTNSAAAAVWTLSYAAFDTVPAVTITTDGIDILTGDFYEISSTDDSVLIIAWFDTAGAAMPFATRPNFAFTVLLVGPRIGIDGVLLASRTPSQYAKLFEGSAT